MINLFRHSVGPTMGSSTETHADIGGLDGPEWQYRRVSQRKSRLGA